MRKVLAKVVPERLTSRTQHTQVTADALAPSSEARTWQETDGVIFSGSHCPVELSACQVQNEIQSTAHMAGWVATVAATASSGESRASEAQVHSD